MFLVSVISFLSGGINYWMYCREMRKYRATTAEGKTQASKGLYITMKIVVYGYLLLAVYFFALGLKTLFLMALNLTIF